MKEIINNLKNIHSRIHNSCQKYQRSIDSVQLLCVSKTKSIDMIKCAYNQGERHFGESYVQEAVDKIITLKNEGFNDICWHFIGPIQSNKTKYIANYFDVVESVDRIKILERLNDQRDANLPKLKVFIQVNISHESQKQGCESSELLSLLEKANSLEKIQVIGLMGVAKINASQAELEQSFLSLKSLRDQYALHYPHLKELSMGMSEDMDIAIKCFSSEIRIGSAIFGEREYKSKS